jgi:hypothetical protein
MRACLLLLVLAPFAAAQDRYAERTGTHHIPKEHTAERAGIDRPVNHVQPSITSHTTLGYVNGATFGSDYVGLVRWPSRVFPGLWPSRPKSFSDKYATDSHVHIPDVIAAQPIRRAVKDAKEERGGE